MSPRAFRTMLVGPMSTKDRLELESKVLAQALKQSVELGDSQGVSLAHRQIFLLIRSAHQAGEESQELKTDTSEDKPKEKNKKRKKRKLPNIVWTEAEDDEEDETTQSDEEIVAQSETTGEQEISDDSEDKEPEPEPEAEPDEEYQESLEDDEEEILDLEPAEETVEIPLSDNQKVEEIQKKAIEAASKEDDMQSRLGAFNKSSNLEGGVAPLSDMHTQEIKALDENEVQGVPWASKEKKEEETEPAPEIESENLFDAYGVLGLKHDASFELIHITFLAVIKKLLFKLRKTRRRKKRELLNKLQELWIAHDVLTDPVTRTDYDFRMLGLRGAPDVIIDTPVGEGQVVIGSEVPLRIGELLQCAGLLEPTELEIAADMHRAMPEMLFGAFLVKQSFISEHDLEQVLMGQRLLKMGYMSVATFQSSMQQWINSDIPIYESAVTDGLITLSEMERIIAQGLKDTDTEIPALQGGGQVGIRSSARSKMQSFASGPMINEEEVAKRNLSANHAVPQWKDQLDWSAPPEEEESKKVVRKRKRTTIDASAYEIEGVTNSSGKASPDRKSLRSLMKGMRLDDEEDDSEDVNNEESNDEKGALRMMLETAEPDPNASTGYSGRETADYQVVFDGVDEDSVEQSIEQAAIDPETQKATQESLSVAIPGELIDSSAQTLPDAPETESDDELEEQRESQAHLTAIEPEEQVEEQRESQAHLTAIEPEEQIEEQRESQAHLTAVEPEEQIEEQRESQAHLTAIEPEEQVEEQRESQTQLKQVNRDGTTELPIEHNDLEDTQGLSREQIEEVDNFDSHEEESEPFNLYDEEDDYGDLLDEDASPGIDVQTSTELDRVPDEEDIIRQLQNSGETQEIDLSKLSENAKAAIAQASQANSKDEDELLEQLQQGGETQEIDLSKLSENAKAAIAQASQKDSKIDKATAKEIKDLADSIRETGESMSPEEVTRQALKKSMEWQVMYKIKGNLADVLLSDSEDTDMPSLAPRLEDIDVIPKGMVTGNEDSSENDFDEEEDYEE